MDTLQNLKPAPGLGAQTSCSERELLTPSVENEPRTLKAGPATSSCKRVEACSESQLSQSLTNACSLNSPPSGGNEQATNPTTKNKSSRKRFRDAVRRRKMEGVAGGSSQSPALGRGAVGPVKRPLSSPAENPKSAQKTRTYRPTFHKPLGLLATKPKIKIKFIFCLFI